MSLLLPEDIDFPVSETYRDGLAQMHGWDIQPVCKSLREARFDDDIERVRQSKQEMSDYYTDDKEWIRKLYHRVETLETEVKFLRNENAYLQNRLIADQKQKERIQAPGGVLIPV